MLTHLIAMQTVKFQIFASPLKCRPLQSDARDGRLPAAPLGVRRHNVSPVRLTRDPWPAPTWPKSRPNDLEIPFQLAAVATAFRSDNIQVSSIVDNLHTWNYTIFPYSCLRQHITR